MALSKDQTTREVEYEFYELERRTVYKPLPNEFVIANASVGSCGLCSSLITGMGGSLNMVCIDCGDLLQNGQLRGCVVRENAGV